VVDPDPEVRGVLMTVLGYAYQVIDAPDAASALALAVRSRPAVVVSGLDMPVVNGERLIGLLTVALGDHAPPVVIVAGRAPRRLEGVKAAAVVQRPFTPDELLDAVASVQPPG
jgi:DNA-binding response OmpR family regulator